MVYRQSALSLIVACLFVTGCGAQNSSEDTEARTDSAFVPGPRPAPEDVARALDSLAGSIVARGLAPAIGIALVMDGRTVMSKAYGMASVTDTLPADDRTLWYIASTSKSLTGFGISLLAQQGVIDFSAPITTLLPKAQWPDGVDAGTLTLASFLSHTHKMNDIALVMTAAFTGAFPESEWPWLIRFATPAPDQGLVYSNFGYNVAAMVIDAERPEGWRRYLDSAVYKPAGMTETYARVSGLERRIAKPHDLLEDGRYATAPFFKVDATMNSAGGHASTLHDLARWVTVQCEDGMLDGKRVFPAEAVALSHRLIAKQTRERSMRFAYFDREGWGAGWDVGSYRGQAMVSRFGSYSTTRSHLSFLPGRRIGVVAQTNGERASVATDILAAFAYDLGMGDPDARATAAGRVQGMIDSRPAVLKEIAEVKAKHAARQEPLRRPMADFAGSYRHEWYGVVTFEVRGGRLHYTWGALYGDAEVLDAGDDVLRIDVGETGNSVDFEFGSSGPARSIELRDEIFKRQ